MFETHGSPSARGWVLYDGTCGICSRWVPFWAPTLQHVGLDQAPLQSAWVLERTGLPLSVLLEDLRLLHTDGRLTSGADVYRFVMQRRWWAYPLYLLSIMPGGRQVFDHAYRAFARHRLQISSVCRVIPPAAHDE